MLYRVHARWSNQRIRLDAGKAYELTFEEVVEVRRDCGEEAVTALSGEELQSLSDALADVGIGNASFRPPAVSNAGRGTGSGAGAMTTAGAFGGALPR